MYRCANCDCNSTFVSPGSAPAGGELCQTTINALASAGSERIRGAFDRGGQSGRLGLKGALVFFLATFLTLAVMFWPYMIPYKITVASAAAPQVSLSFLFCGAGPLGLPVIAPLYRGRLLGIARRVLDRGQSSDRAQCVGRGLVRTPYVPLTLQDARARAARRSQGHA